MERHCAIAIVAVLRFVAQRFAASPLAQFVARRFAASPLAQSVARRCAARQFAAAWFAGTNLLQWRGYRTDGQWIDASLQPAPVTSTIRDNSERDSPSIRYTPDACIQTSAIYRI